MQTNSICVTFRTHLISSERDEVPAGEPIARQLEGELSAAGFHEIVIDDWRDMGYTIDLRSGKVKLNISFAATNNGIYQWALYCSDSVGIWAKLAARPGAIELMRLATTVDRTFQADSRYYQIRWHLFGWQSIGDEPWIDTLRSDDPRLIKRHDCHDT